jgi:hypothetical protein
MNEDVDAETLPRLLKNNRLVGDFLSKEIMEMRIILRV